jgi:hypothetical protein
MAVQGATRADQSGPDASQPPAPDGAVATVAPPVRGLEMQPEEKVRMHACTRARTCRQPRCALADARTDARIGLHSTRTKHTLTHTLSHSRTPADTHVRAYT